MKRRHFILLLPVIFIFSGFNTTPDKNIKQTPAPAIVQTNIEGYLGSKIDLCTRERIKKQDVDHLVQPFRSRNETRLWQGEFWGKWILSAISAYNYKNDPELLTLIQRAVKGILATQTPDGYIGNYAPEARLKHWDIWGCKYTMLGLLTYYDLSNDKKALEAARRLADFLLNLIGPGKADIVKTGNYRGMPSSSILEPMVMLYNRTQNNKYLDFSKYIVAQWETPDGPKLISKGMEGIPVAGRFPHPPSWWSWDNGQKAYEMMSCYDGLLELYKITGDQSYLRVVDMVARDIIRTEINAAGSGTAFECFYHGAQRQTEPTYHTMETCVTFTWMKLCNNLLQLTRNPLYADQIEKTTFNALLASMKFDGSQLAKYSPLEGRRQEGEEQCGMHINCCNANGPRAFALIPEIAVQAAGSDIFINLYNQSKSVIELSNKNRITLSQQTDYPLSGHIEITVHTVKAGQFTINLRIPLWSSETKIQVNGSPMEEIVEGTYLKITRLWKPGDKISLTLDMKARLTELNGHQAILRGPVLLSRDSRFNDGFVDEAAVIEHKNEIIDLKPGNLKPNEVWMSFTAPLILGADLEGEFGKPREIHFCDFASAGNTWDANSRYRVWIKKTLHVMQTPYTKY